MKKTLVYMAIVICVGTCMSTAALALPLTGLWNSTTTGLGDNFNGVIAILDPDNDGASIGDEIQSMDSSSDSVPGSPYYWGELGLIRDSMNLGTFMDNGDGTISAPFESTRSGGTFYIMGDHLWGQAPGNIYTISIQGTTNGRVYYYWNDFDEQWIFSRYEGIISWWGQFDSHPFLFDFAADILLDYHGPSSYFGIPVISGHLSNVQMRIDPVPEPATMILLGSGLIGITMLRKKMTR